MAVAALIVSMLAVVISGLSVWYVRRQTLAAEDAAADARRSADAAAEAVSFERDEADRNRVDFRLVHAHGKAVYVLRNDGRIRHTVCMSMLTVGQFVGRLSWTSSQTVTPKSSC